MGRVGTERGGAADVLLSKPHDLHFSNTLRESPHLLKGAASSRPREQLTEAEMNADKRMRQIKAHKAHESEEAREEANLKAELDADTKKKQALELKSEEKGEDLKHLLSMDKEASVAKTEKVHTGKASLKENADAKEEAALRSKLNAEVKEKQQQLYRAGESNVAMKGGVKSIARASAIDANNKMSEGQLEAQLRASLNAKVSTEQKSMFKSALSTYLASSSGVKDLSTVVSKGGGASGTAPNAAGSKAAVGGGSSSLKAAEQIMKMSMTVSKGGPVVDTTLAHATLSRGRHAAAKARSNRLANLENEMLQSSMNAAKRDAPEIAKRDAAKAKLEAKRRAAEKAAKKPSYDDAMMAFSKRLVHSDKTVRAKIMPKHETLAEAGTVNKARLEAAIKRKVAERLAKGSSALEAERKQLAKQFSGAHSLFGKAEQSELRGLQGARHSKLAAVGGGPKGEGSPWAL